MKNTTLPMNLQFFAEGDAGLEGNSQQGQQGVPADTTAVQIDYDKIQQMLNGTLAAKEDTALKAYFKQQGLSQEEAEQAMTEFKKQKANSLPDVGALQTQLTQAQKVAQDAAIEKVAILQGINLGLDVKTVPHVLKLADLSKAVGEDGKVNEDFIKEAINKVLEEVPALKPQPGQSTGFMQVGAGGNQGQAQTTNDDLKKAFGL